MASDANHHPCCPDHHRRPGCHAGRPGRPPPDLARRPHARSRRRAIPQVSPDGKWIAYTVGDARRREGQARHRPLDGQLGRHPAGAPDVDGRNQREPPAMEPRRPVPGLPDRAWRRGAEEEGRAGLAAEPPGRRGAEADRPQGRRLRLRLVARREAARAGRSTTSIRHPTRRRWRAGSARPSRRSSSTATTSSRTRAATSGALYSHLSLFDVDSKKVETLTTRPVRRRVTRRGRPTGS